MEVDTCLTRATWHTGPAPPTEGLLFADNFDFELTYIVIYLLLGGTL